MRLTGINKSYGGTRVLADFDAVIPNDAACWIMGESGRGKTTLLRIIAGLEDFSGEIYDRPPGRVSAVFQEDRLFEELSPLENCFLVKRGGDFDPESALLHTGLSREDIRRPAKELSGGMKRRTAIVRALCPDFGILLLDEPFKGIDPENRLKTAEIILARTAGKTVIGVTHDETDAGLIPGSIVKI